MIVHAGLIAALRNGVWRGVLIQGSSGVGKSDLALRAMDHGFRLVADDRVVIFTSGARLFGRPPEPLRGLAELRGLGVIPVDAIRLAEIALLIDCVAPDAPERMPELRFSHLLSLDVPTMALCSLDASAPAKLCRALEVLGRARQQDYDAAFPQMAPRG